MIKAISVFSFFVACFAFAKNSPTGCDTSLAYSLQNEGGKDAHHTTSISGKTVLVGGKGHKYAENIDFLAVQRGLLYCSPAIIQCFTDNKITDPVDMVVSFQLQTSEMKKNGDISKASQIGIEWKSTKKPVTAEPCLKKLVSEIPFGLVVKQSTTMSIPIKIEN